jgi:hypothetical protein
VGFATTFSENFCENLHQPSYSSVGPLGDQIVRGEMAAPTGRNKDRARMDEDEVGGFGENLPLNF